MTLKSYLWGMRLSAILSIAGLGLVVFYVNPQQSGIFGQVLFYLILFLALSGIFILFLTGLRKKTEEEEDSFVYLGMSFRQGMLLALLAVLLLVMQSFRILVWWDGLLAVAAILLVELYFLSR